MHPNYKIIADSCCDYTDDCGGLDWLERIPLTIELDGQQMIDDDTLDCRLLAEKMQQSKNAPRSACPSPAQFAAACDCDAVDVYIVALSDKQSGTYGSAVVGAEMARSNGRGQNIHVFNSNSATSGEVAVCMKLHTLAEQGKRFAEIVREVQAFIDEMTTIFVLENLEVLRKAGRLSHLQALAAGALRIKLVMGSQDGNIMVLSKALTAGRAISSMVEHIKQKCAEINPAEKLLFISHCNCLERAIEIRDRVLQECGFAGCAICRTSGVSTIYANVNGVVVAF
ncbi:MAG: DegV family protein [Christensenellaceae bacterium]|jgi:DegV family protein with EDD domain|nr:DegV family protein [Christensenellaceae bacterium]